MTLGGMTMNAGAWLAPMTAVAATVLLAALVLLRDHLRLERHTLALEREVARLREAARLMSEASRTARGSGGKAPDAPSAPRKSATLVETSAEPAPAEPRPTRILLAEDDDVNALFALQALGRTGAVVDWVPDGEAAYEAIRASFAGKGPVYQVVLMDLRMPRLDGIEATRQIRRLEAALQRTEPLRIIAVTATTMRRDRYEAERAGVDLFLAKPYASEALAMLVTPEEMPLRQAS